MKKTAFFSTILFFLLSYSCIAQFTIPEKPAFQTSVYDYANLLSSVDKSQLEEKLVRYSDSTTTQIVVITIESLKGEYIATLATNWAQTWGIGDAKKDNGVLILVSKTDRKTWISPGYGVEDKLIAATCADITKTIINPEFKTGNFYGGLDKGADAIFQVLQGKFKGTRIDDNNDGGGIFPILFFVVIFLVIFFISRKNNGGNSGNNSGGGPSILDMIILSNLGRSSGGSFGGGGFGGGSSGGGFGGGFGGGGFSGGGGGGDW